ncbi:MAG: ABC transporter permease [Myxococcales bacterium]|nr:ABC transporter permease [Myxococcales bacterium]
MKLRTLLLALLVVGAVVPYDALAVVQSAAPDLGPTLGHAFGTDHLGRDVLARALASARSVLLPGGGAILIAAGLGIPLGTLAGWYGGPIAAVIRGVAGGAAAIPSLVLVLLACLAFRGGPTTLAVACGLASVPAVVEAVYERLDALLRAEFVLAARGHGIGDGRILAYHLLWTNARAPVGRELLATLGLVVVTEVTLSCLGAFGVPEPAPSWGNMIAHALRTGTANPLAWAVPSVAALATVAATVASGGASPPGEHRSEARDCRVFKVHNRT